MPFAGLNQKKIARPVIMRHPMPGGLSYVVSVSSRNGAGGRDAYQVACVWYSSIEANLRPDVGSVSPSWTEHGLKTGGCHDCRSRSDDITETDNLQIARVSSEDNTD